MPPDHVLLDIKRFLTKNKFHTSTYNNTSTKTIALSNTSLKKTKIPPTSQRTKCVWQAADKNLFLGPIDVMHLCTGTLYLQSNNFPFFFMTKKKHTHTQDTKKTAYTPTHLWKLSSLGGLRARLSARCCAPKLLLALLPRVDGALACLHPSRDCR